MTSYNYSNGYGYSSSLVSFARLIHVPGQGLSHHHLFFGGGICSWALLWLSSTSTTSGVGVVLVHQVLVLDVAVQHKRLGPLCRTWMRRAHVTALFFSAASGLGDPRCWPTATFQECQGQLRESWQGGQLLRLPRRRSPLSPVSSYDGGFSALYWQDTSWRGS
jgi:hypothetical protein